MRSHGFPGLELHHSALAGESQTMGEIVLMTRRLSEDERRSRLQVSSLGYQTMGFVLCAISFFSFGLKIRR